MNLLGLPFGAAVGLSLGLTGGGGAIFAVPLLVYGLGIPPREAAGVSLAAVGATAFIGFLRRLRIRQVELRTGLLFAAAGMAGAPLGTWTAGRLPEVLLLLLFAVLMLLIAARMWGTADEPGNPELECGRGERDQPTCARDAGGTLILTSRCAVLLGVLGILTGILSGLFGVGGGIVIVPALVLFSQMEIHRAVGTSLLVISLVSVAGIASHLSVGRPIAPSTTALFIAGGIAGLFAGQRMSRQMSGPRLQKVFAAAIVAVALSVIVRNLGV